MKNLTRFRPITPLTRHHTRCTYYNGIGHPYTRNRRAHLSSAHRLVAAADDLMTAAGIVGWMDQFMCESDKAPVAKSPDGFSTSAGGVGEKGRLFDVRDRETW